MGQVTDKEVFLSNEEHLVYFGLQRKIGLSVSAISLLLAVLNFFRFLFLYRQDITSTLFNLSVIVLIATSLLTLWTGLNRGKLSRIVQVMLFLVLGIIAALDTDPGSLTSAVFLGLGYWLAFEYGFLAKYMLIKFIILFCIYGVFLFIGVSFIDPAPVMITINTFMIIGLLSYLFLTIFRFRINQHKNREIHLEKVVADRTANLEKLLAEKEKLLKDKDILLREVHHRTKNNMQLISSLLNIEFDVIGTPSIERSIRNSKDRIHSLALVHDYLYRSEDLSHIDVSDYTKSLVEDIWEGFSQPSMNLELEIEHKCSVTIDFAIPFGLIVNELVTNAVKHAFTASHSSGTLSVHISRQNSHVITDISDDGVGMPESTDIQNPDSIGLRLVALLTDQLSGSIELKPCNGTCWHLELPFTESKR